MLRVMESAAKPFPASLDGGVYAFGVEEGDERGYDLIGERAGEGKLAVEGGDAGLEEGFEFGGLPPDEVGEVRGLKLAAGGGGELDDEGGGVDGVGDVGEEAGVGDALQRRLRSAAW